MKPFVRNIFLTDLRISGCGYYHRNPGYRNNTIDNDNGSANTADSDLQTMQNDTTNELQKCDKKSDKDKNDDAIVIAGISVNLPNANGLDEFSQNLMAGLSLLHIGAPNINLKQDKPLSSKSMKITKVNDWVFKVFGVSLKSFDVINPKIWKQLETSIEAVNDAGISSEELQNVDTCFFLESVTSNNYSDPFDGYSAFGDLVTKYSGSGSSTASLDSKFNRYRILVSDSCNSLNTLQIAFNAINRGFCQQAVVAGITHVENTLPCGPTSSSTDAVVAMLIQKKRHAKRYYATIRALKSFQNNLNSQGQDPMCSSSAGKNLETLLREIYLEANIDPGKVTFIETYGAGTGVDAEDSAELNSIFKILCRANSRTEPLLIGSVRSNIGYPKSGTGLIGIAKLIVASNLGIIPANFNYKTPKLLDDFLFDGSLDIVGYPKLWKGGIVGVNSFGVEDGSCAHLVLEFNGRKTLN